MWIEQPKKPEIDHRTIKLLIGLIALSLPILTDLFAKAPLESISASYHEGGWAQSIFIGFLFSIASFLAAYNGAEPSEKVLSKIAAVCGLGVALFPCGCGKHEVAVPFVHFTSAGIMFLILAAFCLIFYRRAKTKSSREAGRRAVVYAASGIVILASILVVALDGLLNRVILARVPRLVFYGETAALLAFGIAWLAASHVLPVITHKDERDAYRQGRSSFVPKPASGNRLEEASRASA